MLDVMDLVLGLLDLPDIAPRRFRKAPASWPAAQATILSGRIEKRAGRYVVSAPYWFYADGERYGARYEREFISESQARAVLQRLFASPPMVRYKPGDADTSILDAGSMSEAA